MRASVNESECISECECMCLCLLRCVWTQMRACTYTKTHTHNTQLSHRSYCSALCSSPPHTLLFSTPTLRTQAFKTRTRATASIALHSALLILSSHASLHHFCCPTSTLFCLLAQHIQRTAAAQIRACVYVCVYVHNCMIVFVIVHECMLCMCVHVCMTMNKSTSHRALSPPNTHTLGDQTRHTP